MGMGEDEFAAMVRDARPSKSAVADFDTFGLPKSGKPDFGRRAPHHEGCKNTNLILRSRAQHGVSKDGSQQGLAP